MTTTTIGGTTFRTPSDTELVISRLFDAPRERLFEACAKHEHVPEWLPSCVWVGVRPDGEWLWVCRNPHDGSEFEWTGIWLIEEDGKTRLTIATAFPSKEARDAAVEAGMNEDAAKAFDRLAAHLRTVR